MRHLFNSEAPDGYESRGGASEFEVENISFSKSQRLIGDLYEGQTYQVKNKSNTQVKLYEEMFYQEGVYAVAFEADVLNPGEQTRLFMVRTHTQE